MNRGYPVAATGTVPGRHLTGFYVCSTVAGTILFRHTNASGVAITTTITPAVGWHDLPVTFDGGSLHFTIGGTLSVVLVVE